MAQGGTGVNSIKVTGNVFFNCELQKSFAFIILLCRVFFIVPPHFQCLNEKSCLAKRFFLCIEISRKKVALVGGNSFLILVLKMWKNIVKKAPFTCTGWFFDWSAP